MLDPRFRQHRESDDEKGNWMVLSRNMASVAVLLAAIALSSGLALATETPAARQPDTASSRVDMARLQQDAALAQAKIQSNTAELDALVGAVRSGNVVQVKAILSRNGFGASDLANTRVSLSDKTGGNSSSTERPKHRKIHIEIWPDCCPPQIHVTIHF